MLRNVVFVCIALSSLFWSLAAFSIDCSNCPQALPTKNPGFCKSFVTAASCHCVKAGIPAEKCKNMREIYDRMIALFGTTRKACEFQKDTSPDICVDDWNCYLKGGRDSKNNLCSSSGKAC